MTGFRRFALTAQKVLNAPGILDWAERRLLPRRPAQVPPPILILGCPRSGTTLLYELLTANHRTAYPSNIAELLYRSPVLASRIGLAIVGRQAPRYASSFGYVPGLLAPSEARALLRHWFTGPQPLSVTDPAHVSSVLASLSQMMGGPLVLKNLYLERVFDLILATFPGIVVLRIHREARFTAQSILALRRRQAGSEDEWYGPRPDGYEQVLRETPARQVAWQIQAIERGIDQFLERAELTSRSFTCSYEELCAMPRSIVSQFIARYRELTGYAIAELRPMPEHFLPSQRINMPPHRWAELEAAISEMSPGSR
jgi:hypothetical protein